MRSLNRAELIGHLGADPELRMLEGGQAQATFAVATSWRWHDAAGQDHEETEWSRCVAWGPLAEICGRVLVKGAHVYLNGRLRTRRWEDTQSGTPRSRTEIVIDEVLRLDVRPVVATADAEQVVDAGAPSRAPPRRSWVAPRATPPAADAQRRGPLRLRGGR